MNARILVVEDEAHLADGIRENLLAEGYEVVLARDGMAGLEAWRQHEVDLIVLDVMLPLRDGFAVCKDIRDAGGRLPILFLTAKNSPEDRIRGLEVGGDDYLGKPFHLRELLMRVQAMLRRQVWYGKAPTAGPSFSLAGTTVDFRTYEVRDADGRVEVLPQKEVMILKLLVERAGEVVSRDEILNQVWGYDVYPSSRTVDNFIVRLRRRFEPDAAEPRYFHTIRGVGYKFTPEA
jgi:two-component system alkaline phosphatase synthesis response regulator PhoP